MIMIMITTTLPLQDAMTGLSKGFCFIEYRTEEAANAALRSMNGFIIHGRAIKVNMPTAPGSANAAAAQQQQQQQQLHPQQPQHSMLVPAQQPQPVQSRACRIYVGSVAYNVPEEQLKAVFSAFGPIKSCQMISVRLLSTICMLVTPSILCMLGNHTVSWREIRMSFHLTSVLTFTFSLPHPLYFLAYLPRNY